MKKTMLVITGLVCVALLGVCGNQKSASELSLDTGNLQIKRQLQS